MGISILITVVAVALVVLLLMAISGASKKGGSGKGLKNSNKSKSALAKECIKKLTRDPHNVQALLTLSDIYFAEQNYEKAYPLYETLTNIARMHIEINQMTSVTRLGICAFHCGKPEEALSAFSSALRLDPQNYDCNYYLGRILFDRKEFEKSVVCFKRAQHSRPESTEVNQQLGFALFGSKKYRDSLTYLRKALDEHPGDKEILFKFASALDECNMGDKALKIFMHLRPDPVYGAQACIACGSIHQKMNQLDKSLEDYSIALKLETIDTETRLTASYKMAQLYLSQHNIAKALVLLKQIQAISPSYKDVNALVHRYQELNQNSNLQAYLMSGTSDFVALCRKFVVIYYSDSKVRIDDISVAADNIEIHCSVESANWSGTELFRFFRSSGSIGELSVRDLHNKVKEIKCDKGLCVTAGVFTEETKKYAENRPIDLVEKNKLVSVLKKIS